MNYLKSIVTQLDEPQKVVKMKNKKRVLLAILVLIATIGHGLKATPRLDNLQGVGVEQVSQVDLASSRSNGTVGSYNSAFEDYSRSPDSHRSSLAASDIENLQSDTRSEGSDADSLQGDSSLEVPEGGYVEIVSHCQQVACDAIAYINKHSCQKDVNAMYQRAREQLVKIGAGSTNIEVMNAILKAKLQLFSRKQEVLLVGRMNGNDAEQKKLILKNLALKFYLDELSDIIYPIRKQGNQSNTKPGLELTELRNQKRAGNAQIKDIGNNISEIVKTQVEKQSTDEEQVTVNPKKQLEELLRVFKNINIETELQKYILSIVETQVEKQSTDEEQVIVNPRKQLGELLRSLQQAGKAKSADSILSSLEKTLLSIPEEPLQTTTVLEAASFGQTCSKMSNEFNARRSELDNQIEAHWKHQQKVTELEQLIIDLKEIWAAHLKCLKIREESSLESNGQLSELRTKVGPVLPDQKPVPLLLSSLQSVLLNASSLLKQLKTELIQETKLGLKSIIQGNIDQILEQVKPVVDRYEKYLTDIEKLKIVLLEQEESQLKFRIQSTLAKIIQKLELDVKSDDPVGIKTFNAAFQQEKQMAKVELEVILQLMQTLDSEIVAKKLTESDNAKSEKAKQERFIKKIETLLQKDQSVPGGSLPTEALQSAMRPQVYLDARFTSTLEKIKEFSDQLEKESGQLATENAKIFSFNFKSVEELLQQARHRNKVDEEHNIAEEIDEQLTELQTTLDGIEESAASRNLYAPKNPLQAHDEEQEKEWKKISSPLSDVEATLQALHRLLSYRSYIQCLNNERFSTTLPQGSNTASQRYKKLYANLDRIISIRGNYPDLDPEWAGTAIPYDAEDQVKGVQSRIRKRAEYRCVPPSYPVSQRSRPQSAAAAETRRSNINRSGVLGAPQNLARRAQERTESEVIRERNKSRNIDLSASTGLELSSSRGSMVASSSREQGSEGSVGSSTTQKVRESRPQSAAAAETRRSNISIGAPQNLGSRAQKREEGKVMRERNKIRNIDLLAYSGLELSSSRGSMVASSSREQGSEGSVGSSTTQKVRESRPQSAATVYKSSKQS